MLKASWRSGATGWRGWARAWVAVAIVVVALIGLRVLRAEADRPPVPTQRDLQQIQGSLQAAEVDQDTRAIEQAVWILFEGTR